MSQETSKAIIVAQWGLLDEQLSSVDGDSDAERFLTYLRTVLGLRDARDWMDPVVRVMATKGQFLSDLCDAMVRNGRSGGRHLGIIYIGAHGWVGTDDRPLGLASDATGEGLTFRELGEAIGDALAGFPGKTLVLGSCCSLSRQAAADPDRELQWVPPCVDVVIGFDQEVDPPDAIASLAAFHRACMTFYGSGASGPFPARFLTEYEHVHPTPPKPVVFQRNSATMCWTRTA